MTSYDIILYTRATLTASSLQILNAGRPWVSWHFCLKDASNENRLRSIHSLLIIASWWVHVQPLFIPGYHVITTFAGHCCRCGPAAQHEDVARVSREFLSRPSTEWQEMDSCWGSGCHTVFGTISYYITWYNANIIWYHMTGSRVASSSCSSEQGQHWLAYLRPHGPHSCNPFLRSEACSKIWQCVSRWRWWSMVLQGLSCCLLWVTISQWSCHLQVFFLFWASPVGRPQSEAVPLAFVQFYTTDLTGAMDNTRLTKICWEMESRPAADRFPGMQPKYEVMSVESMIKLEHIVPMWHDTTKEMFYVNKYASFS